jgi:hypothetical protein
MTTAEVTARLLHDLVAGSHAEGITELAVEAAIGRDDNDGQILLIADPDFTDDSWQLPAGPVLPGQTLTDALHPAVAAIGLSIEEVTGYLGHHDHPGSQITRVFRFLVTVTDPEAICRHSGTGHRWVFPDELNCPAAGMAGVPSRAMTMPAAGEPLLAGQLRASARGIYPDEAAVELLISHGTFLRRADFTSCFISAPASGDGTGLAAIDWTAAITALDASLPCSGGEQRMLRLAASLGDGTPVDLRDALTGIDDHGIQLVVQAVLHAAGHPDSPEFHDHF